MSKYPVFFFPRRSRWSEQNRPPTVANAVTGISPSGNSKFMAVTSASTSRLFRYWSQTDADAERKENKNDALKKQDRQKPSSFLFGWSVLAHVGLHFVQNLYLKISAT
jgi:hypothetical protein